MKTNAGYTLVEITLTLALVGIMSGVATVSYVGTKSSNEKRNLKNSAMLWYSAISTCIASNKWKECQICPPPPDPPPQNYCPASQECRAGTQLVFPCEVTGSGQTEIKKNLKKLLRYNCPDKADCIIHTRSNSDTIAEKYQYHCLSIQKEVLGKKLQVITRVQWSNPSKFDMWCNKKDSDLSTYIDVTQDNICRALSHNNIGGAGADKLAPCEGFQ